MQKKFLSNLVILILLNLVIKPLWVLGVDLEVQRLLGPSEFGVYFNLLSFAWLFMAFVDFGLNIYNNREVARAPENMPTLAAQLGTLKLLLGFATVASMLIIGQLYGYSSRQLTLLTGTGSIIFLSSFLLFLRGNISGLQWYRADVLISVLDRSIAIIICGLLLWGGLAEMTIERFVGAQLMGYIIAILIAATLLLRRGASIRFVFNGAQAIGLLKKSFPYMLLTLLVVSYHRIDAVMIERMLLAGAEQAGIYAQAYKLLDAGVMFAYLFSTLLMPMFSRMIEAKERVGELVRLAETLMLIPAAIGVVGAMMYGRDLMDLMYKEQIDATAEVFPFLIAALIPIGATYIYGTLLTAKGDLKVLNTIAAIGAVVNIIGNYFLIQKMGLKGAALMTLITQSIVCISQVVYAHQHFDFRFTKKQVINFVSLFIGLPILVRLNVEFFTDWRIEFAVYLMAAFVLVSVTGLFSFKKLGTILRLREG